MGNEFIGLVTGLNKSGFGLLIEESSGIPLPFRIKAVDGYNGELPEEMTQFSKEGLKDGVLVKFIKGVDGRVLTIYPIKF